MRTILYVRPIVRRHITQRSSCRRLATVPGGQSRSVMSPDHLSYHLPHAGGARRQHGVVANECQRGAALTRECVSIWKSLYFTLRAIARISTPCNWTGLTMVGFCANDAPRDGPFPSCPSWGMRGEGDWTTWRCVVGFCC